MRKIIFILFLLPLIVSAQYTDTIYIDPNAANGGTGTLSNPFNDWDNDIVFTDNTMYLQKRGTSITNSNEIVLDSLFHIYIGAYGTGTIPHIIFMGAGGIIKPSRSSYIKVHDLELSGDVNNSTFGFYVGGFWQAGGGNANDCGIYDCTIHDLYNGVRALPYSTNIDTLKIDGCTIYNTMSDGIFIQEADCTNIYNTHIYNVNMAWHLVAGSHPDDNLSEGDAIQLALGMQRATIRNCILDRRYTGNKFCLIYNTGGASTNGRLLIKDNTFYPPKDTIDGDGGACIFLKWGENIEFRNNKFIGEGYPGGVDDHVMTLSSSNFDTISFIGNLFVNTFETQIGIGGDIGIAKNNTFANTNSFSGNIILRIKNNAIEKNNCYAIQTGDVAVVIDGTATSTTNHTVTGSSSTWVTNPGFNDYANSDYTPKSGSSYLLNRGTSDTDVTIDINGTTRPQGVMDIGAFEYTGGTPPQPHTGTRAVRGKGRTLTLKGKILKL